MRQARRHAQEPNPASAVARVLGERDVRLLLGGASTSLLGDQFALVATPWLTLELTDDPLAVGLVLALEGIPRAAFMLVGGDIVDRWSPRRVMLLADLLRAVLTGLLAAVVLAGAAEMWMLFVFAASFGALSGAAIPAENSIMPRLVADADLQAGNGLIMGVTQLMRFVGPTLAGLVIAQSSDAVQGAGIALGVDAATFCVSALSFALMQPQHRTPLSGPRNLPSSIAVGIRSVLDDVPLRWVFSLLLALNLCALGPLLVGLPLLAHTRLPGGAITLGVLFGSFAGGNLVGLALAGSSRKPSSRALARLVLGVVFGFGLVIASMGLVARVELLVGLLAALGIGNGYLTVSLFTWIQSRTPEELLGRTMSLVAFCSLGLASVSQAAAGAIARWNLDALFLVSGALVLAVSARSARQPGLHQFTRDLAGEPEHPTKEYTS